MSRSNGAAAIKPKPSLRSRLLWQLLPALLLSWVVGSMISIYTSSYFMQQAYDRSILDDAQLLAAHTKLIAGKLALDAREEDLQSILFDPSETIYYAVESRGRLIAGTPGLLPRSLSSMGRATTLPDTIYTDLHWAQKKMKAVVLTRKDPEPYQVVVAVTTGARDALLSQLTVASLLPRTLLMLALVLWLRWVIRRELRPLTHLEESVEERDSADLSPLPEQLTTHAASHDVHTLSSSIDGLLKRVAQSLSQQREFAGNVAHELRTPLAGVRAAAEFGLAQSDPEQWRKQLQEVLRSEQRASHMVEQLLMLALSSEASHGVQMEQLRINDIVREQVLTMLPKADHLGIELVASGLDEDLLVRADRALLEGLLTNLIDNAFRYGRRIGGGDVISVVLSRVAGEVWLSVIDQGPGIPAEQREQLLQRWTQGEEGARIGTGAGLGLSICQRFAKLMHAQLVLDSGFGGQGLRASVVFSGGSNGKTAAA